MKKKKRKIFDKRHIVGSVVLIIVYIAFIVLCGLDYFKYRISKTYEISLIMMIFFSICLVFLLFGLADKNTVADEEKIVQYRVFKRNTIIYWKNVEKIYIDRKFELPIHRFHQYKTIEVPYVKIEDDKNNTISFRYFKNYEKDIMKFYKGRIKGLDETDDRLE